MATCVICLDAGLRAEVLRLLDARAPEEAIQEWRRRRGLRIRQLKAHLGHEVEAQKVAIERTRDLSLVRQGAEPGPTARATVESDVWHLRDVALAYLEWTVTGTVTGDADWTPVGITEWYRPLLTPPALREASRVLDLVARLTGELAQPDQVTQIALVADPSWRAGA